MLRGPQGTLFGRNTPAGAIRYVTRKPEFDEIEGNVKGVVGSKEWRDVTAVLNVPLSDTIAARLSYANNRRGGYVSRVIDDIKTGDQNSSTFRAQLRWKPSSRLDVNASFDSIRTHDNGAPTIIGSYTMTDIHPAALYNPTPTTQQRLDDRNEMRAMAPSWVSPSNYTDAQGDINYYTSQVRGDSQVYGGLVPDRNTFKSTGGSLGIEYELTDDITFKSLTGYRKLEQYMQLDYDRTPLPFQYLKERNNIEYWTQEFQLQGSSFDNKLKWIGGVFYYYDHAINDRRRFDPSTGTTSASAGEPEGIMGSGYRESRDIRTKSIAVFGQATLEVTDRLSATAGLRWNQDKKNYTGFRDGRGRQVVNGPFLPGNVQGEWTSVSPRFALDYKWTDAIMTYASVAKGFKAGGFNDTMQTNCYATLLQNCGLQEYKPENLWTYEAGVRTELFDRRVRFNLTGFYTDYKAQQINLTDVGPPPVQYFVNGDSVVKGIEADLMIAAGRNLVLRGGFGYVEGSYSEVIRGISGAVAINPDMPFYRNPTYSYNIGATYTREVAEGEASLDLNWGYKDRQFSFPSPTAGVWLPSYGLLNARLGYEHKSGWSVALIANNLTDKRYFTNGFDSSGPATKATPGLPVGSHDTLMGYSTFDLGRPREFAFEAKYKF